MNFFLILLLIVLIAAGYYVYQRLRRIEREIRADQHARVADDPGLVPGPEVVPGRKASVSGPGLEVAGDEAPSGEIGTREEVMLAVEETPGLAQTELYGKFPAGDRRELQRLLRELDQAGNLRREKKGSSYRLYPL